LGNKYGILKFNCGRAIETWDRLFWAFESISSLRKFWILFL